MISLLQNKSNIQLRIKPFPYFIIDDALPWDFYSLLDRNFPAFKNIIAANFAGINKYKENTDYRLRAVQSLQINSISEEWKRFIRYHTSYEFVNELLEIFMEPIKEIYKVAKENMPKKEDIGVRFQNESFFNTDCQFVINTPTNGDTTVIEPHLDNPKEFYAALFYMKEQGDDSTGGNLTTHEFIGKPSFYGKSRVRTENIKLIEEIEYKQNRLVVFLNSPNSIHGVTKRSKTEHYRKYINIIGEFNKQLFDYRHFLESD